MLPYKNARGIHRQALQRDANGGMWFNALIVIATYCKKPTITVSYLLWAEINFVFYDRVHDVSHVVF